MKQSQKLNRKYLDLSSRKHVSFVIFFFLLRN